MPKKSLMWVTHAKKRLTAAELQHALAIGKRTLDERQFTRVRDLVSMCAGLITHDTDTDIIRLVHYTTQSYFEEGKFWNSDLDIAKACLTYLALDVFSKPCSTEDELRRRLKKYHLSYYAGRYWKAHARVVQEIVQGDIMKTFQCKGTRGSMYQIKEYFMHPWTMGLELTLLHILAESGLTVACKQIFKDNAALDNLCHERDVPDLTLGINANDPRGRTALHLSAMNGHLEMVTWLCSHNANVDATNKNGQTVLHPAASRGKGKAVEWLVEHRTNINATNRDGRRGVAFSCIWGQVGSCPLAG